MPQSVIIDSRALVALLDPRDQHHAWSRTAVANLPLPWLTCEAVAVETFFLLARPEAARLVRLLNDGRLRGLQLREMDHIHRRLAVGSEAFQRLGQRQFRIRMFQRHRPVRG